MNPWSKELRATFDKKKKKANGALATNKHSTKINIVQNSLVISQAPSHGNSNIMGFISSSKDGYEQIDWFYGGNGNI